MTAALAVVIAVGLAGCAAETDAGSYNLQDEMHDMSMYLSDESNIVDVDIKVLNDFMGSVEKTNYRLRGMVTDYEEELYQGALGDSMARTCSLICDSLTVHVMFADGETAKNGEYIEVVGKPFALKYDKYADDRTQFSLIGCAIVERGASVRGRIEQESKAE